MVEKKHSTARIAVIIFFCFVASFLGSWVFLSTGLISSRNTVQQTTNVVSSEEEATQQTAKKVSPSVVSITTATTFSNGYLQRTSQGAGTGIILSKDGYILTNKHVINGASQVSVVTDEGIVYRDVKVIGSDPLNDIAFLKVPNPKDFQPALLGDSSNVQVGQKVLAIGNALGEFHNSVTSGIISGEGRPITAQDGSSDGESLDNLLQTDAAINPGNSGGPLVNLSGQVVGINTAVAADAQGIGFAIPINAAQGLVKGLLKNGKVERAYLGVGYVNITPAIADQLNLSVTKGAYIYHSNGSAVVAGSPADKAGLRDKDIIVSVDGKQVSQSSGLSLLLAKYMPGDSVKLEIIRGSDKKTVTATLDIYKVQ